MNKFKLSLFHKIFIGMILGALLGIIMGPKIEVIKPIGDLYIKLIKMIIVPLVLFSIISGVTNLSNLTKLRSVGIKAMIYYIGTTFFAVTIGLIMAQIIKPGVSLNLPITEGAVEMKELPSWSETLLNIVPTNPIAAFVEGNMLQIIFFAIIFGIGLVLVGEKGKVLRDMINGGAEAMYKVTDIVMSFSPYGVFRTASLVSAYSDSAFNRYCSSTTSRPCN